MAILPPEYAEGRNVILFLSIGGLIDMATGINYIIMITSKFYRFDGYFTIIVLLLTILANYLLIPIYGIVGSAMATAMTITVYNVMRWLFLYNKFKMQPFDSNTIKIIAIAFVAFLPGYLIPHFPAYFNSHLINTIIDIALRSSIVGGAFILLVLKTEAAPEINNKIRKNLKRFSINL
jgi:O-antigen/teichoic acid export membrane protein